MRRHFMTIPEAVGGEVFFLDMGVPMRILDLARDMIRLSGLEPDVAILIVFAGPRSGWRLPEELRTDDEDISARPRVADCQTVCLEEACT